MSEHGWKRAWREARDRGKEGELKREIGFAKASAALRNHEELLVYAAEIEARRCACGSPLRSLRRKRCPACAFRSGRGRS